MNFFSPYPAIAFKSAGEESSPRGVRFEVPQVNSEPQLPLQNISTIQGMSDICGIFCYESSEIF